MSNVSPQQFQVIQRCITKVAKHRTMVAACIYGSRVAGYNRPDSDIDLLIVLENYPYMVKYAYFRESDAKVSALAVDREALLRDAQSAFLGEFVVGRLLHIYEPIANAQFLTMIENIYKRRVILEEVRDILEYAGVLGTEIVFPLEFVAFSKIKRRMSLYANAAYSYYKTYTCSKRNIEFALEGYHKAVADIISENDEIFVARQDGLLQISDKHEYIEKRPNPLKLTKRLREFSSYLVHTYAGRKIIHFAIDEAESKIRRRIRMVMPTPPDFMLSPRKTYWRLPEGIFITDGRNWLDDLVQQHLGRSYSVAQKRRLGSKNSTTTLYVLKHFSDEYKIAVKEVPKSKALKWAMIGLWSTPVKRFRMNPLLRIGSEYKAIRYMRSLGLHTPVIEAVVLDRRLLVTRFLDGMTLADVIGDCMKGKGDSSLIRKAGAEIAKIHRAGATLGDIKPKHIIVKDNRLYFTHVEQFMLNAGDAAWDIAQFVSWGVKNMRNGRAAATIIKEFVEGYVDAGDPTNVLRLAKDKQYIESFYPILAPSIVRTIKSEINAIAS
jgi:tRNA A-37 threonylcarbamoyl transferase component Bud32/predicted nucleotidyltransferase